MLQAKVINVGTGGPLLCRILLELVGANPDSAVCEESRLPVRASFEWNGGGKLTFQVSSLLIRPDFHPSAFTIPPTTAELTDTGIPLNPNRAILTDEQLKAFRTRAISPATRTDPQSHGAPSEGVIAVNQSDTLQAIVIEGVPVAWIPPHNELHIAGPRHGKYKGQWQSFLGTTEQEPFEFIAPARITNGNNPSPSGN